MSESIKLPSQVFAEGMSARGLGKPVTACPYPEGSGDRDAWTDGWHEGDALDEDSGHQHDTETALG